MPTEVLEWFAESRMALLENLSSKSKIKSLEKSMSAQQSLKDLATRGSDTVGIDFSSEPLQYLYFSTKFERRGLLMYSVLQHVMKTTEVNDSALLRIRQV